MFSALASVLLLGMVPITGWAGGGTDVGTAHLTVTPPLRAPAAEAASLDRLRNRLSASGILILDLQSAQHLFGLAADTPRPMASLTKLMTALLIVEQHDLDEWVTVPSAAAEVGGNLAYLPVGQQFRVRDLLSALLIASGNDAAITLAQYHSGSMAAFVEEMNERARVLGLKRTRYSNPTGLDAPGQQSSPQDLAWLAMAVMRFDPIRTRLGMRGAQIASRAGDVIHLTHTNALLHAATPVVAGKTGTTDQAGQCLLSVVEEGGRQLLVVILKSVDRYADMRTILEALSA